MTCPLTTILTALTKEKQSKPLLQKVARIPTLVQVWQDDKQPRDRVFMELVVLDQDSIDTLLCDDETVDGLLLHSV